MRPYVVAGGTAAVTAHVVDLADDGATRAIGARLAAEHRPGRAAYAASKFAVRGFTESLRAELARDGVGVTVVHPGGIRTRIAESARVGSGVDAAQFEAGRRQFAKLLRIPPGNAAALIVAAVEQRRPRLLIGASARVPDVLVRLFPGGYSKPLSRRR